MGDHDPDQPLPPGNTSRIDLRSSEYQVITAQLQELIATSSASRRITRNFRSSHSPQSIANQTQQWQMPFNSEDRTLTPNLVFHGRPNYRHLNFEGASARELSSSGQYQFVSTHMASDISISDQFLSTTDSLMETHTSEISAGRSLRHNTNETGSYNMAYPPIPKEKSVYLSVPSNSKTLSNLSYLPTSFARTAESNIAAVVQPFRYPHGPQDAESNVGFDWVQHARLIGRDNLYTRSSSGETAISINNSQFCRQEPAQDATRFVIERPYTYQPGLHSTMYQDESPALHRGPRATTLNFQAPGRSVSTEMFGYPNPQGSFARAISPTHQSKDICAHSNVMLPPSSFSLQTPHPRPFVASTMRLQEKGLVARDPNHLAPGSSYKGNIWAASYLDQVENLPDIENGSLWLEGIPPNTPHSVIFDEICYGVGAVWSLHLNPITEIHYTMAATLVFMKPESAAAVMNRYQQYGIKIGTNVLRLRYNRFGSRRRNTSETRVLQIEGPVEKMTWMFWREYFNAACVYQMDRWLYIPCNSPGRLRMEFRFSRIDGQAQTCRQSLERDRNMRDVLWKYGSDPCEQQGFL
ncbi:hypothetical protein EG329_010158 [Mollisiaceae sp. DMI_Dod_QoI]|nr:hypothetical protein EG329_010158 [Helotiales sp. DMI_Dod_QoI]